MFFPENLLNTRGTPIRPLLLDYLRRLLTSNSSFETVKFIKPNKNETDRKSKKRRSYILYGLS